MTSTFHSIETSKRALFSQQAAINTTGHNIANANTPGYSRQRVNLVATRPIEAPGAMRSNVPGQLGTGVEFTSITRIRETFLDDQYRNTNQTLGKWSIQSDTLNKLETVFNEPSDSGIRTVFDNFWKSWTDLSKDPESITGRKIVRENAKALVDAFNETGSRLNDLTDDLTTNVGVKVNQVNTISNSIASLNGEIKRLEAYGDNPNDLYDQRDLLVDQLSQIVNVSVTKDTDGYNIRVGGTTLVAGEDAPDTTAAAMEQEYSRGALKGGEIVGLFVSRDNYVADYKSQLNAMADTLVNGEISVTIPAGSTYNGVNLTADQTVTVKGINGLHKLGYLFSQPPNTPQQAGDFFSSANGPLSPITADSIRLSTAIDNDPMQIATSMRIIATAGVPETVKGNNTLANLMAGLKGTPYKFTPTASSNGISNGTIDEYYAAMIGQLGVQAQEADRQATNQKDIVTQIDSSRQSVSGVSLDEEMSELIKFQHSYAAAARFMTTIDQTLDKIINGMGVVGR